MDGSDGLDRGSCNRESKDHLGESAFLVMHGSQSDKMGLRSSGKTSGLPIQKAKRRIEHVTQKLSTTHPWEVGCAHPTNNCCPATVKNAYDNNQYIHVYIEP